MYIELRKGIVRWYLALVAKNGEDLMVSQHYYSKANAKRAANKLAAVLKFTTKEKK